MSSEALAITLFDEAETLDSLDSLHTVAFALRKVFKSVGAEDLLESTRGWYRIAFCDLHEFDAFFGKGQALEDRGFLKAAALFYELALMLGRGPLFEDLPEEFTVERQRYEERVRHARSFVRKHEAI